MRKTSPENFKSFTVPSMSGWTSPRRHWTDMAYALAGVDNITSKYARLKYAGEERNYNEVFEYILRKVAAMNHVEFPNRYFIYRITELAMKEAVMTDICRRCSGKGTIHTGYKALDCFSCDGTGVLRKTEGFRAKFVGVHRHTWRKRWKYIFRQNILGLFDVLEDDIYHALRKRL